MAKWIYEKYNFIIENLPQTPKEGVASSTRHTCYYPDGTLRASNIPNGSSTLNGYVFTNYGDHAFDRPQKYYYGIKTLTQSLSNGNIVNLTQRVPLAENITHQEFCSLFGTKTTHIETLVTEEGTYPDDGVHTDLYWYVKVKKAFPEIKFVDGTTLKTATSAYVVQGGQLKSVADIYTVQDGQIKKAK